jgi:hypothetical protein
MTSASLKWCENANQRVEDERRNRGEDESLEFVVETVLLPARRTGKGIQTAI